MSFGDKKIRDVCENTDIAEQMFGITIATQIKNRISDLLSVNTFNEFPFPINRLSKTLIEIKLDLEYSLTVEILREDLNKEYEESRIKVVAINKANERSS
ncbi:MAG: hypothetical protein COA58_08410 [Bacteroidetes bacterium]|nr:MAG: hypothetical protein COA58_08410 [Bacteroidota bacterium]